MHGFQEMWLPIWGNLQSKSDLSRPYQNMVLCKRLIRNEKHCWTLISISRATRVSQPAESGYRKERAPFETLDLTGCFGTRFLLESMLLSFLKNITAQSLNKTIWFGNLLYKSSRKFKTWYENFAIKKHINTCTCTTFSQNFHSLLKFSMVYTTFMTNGLKFNLHIFWGRKSAWN